jgi:hypothetical protein
MRNDLDLVLLVVSTRSAFHSWMGRPCEVVSGEQPRTEHRR